ncbi:MAG TPA: ABC transporter ATP-binding protein [Candidatus Eremiobacteraceae bacterium]|nr:ABC transporter ATP-binding protein [Candidatus Eremiobacteraceae bacterium]
MSALLTGRGLAVRYGPREIFTGLDISIAAGGLVALVGPNGAGKSSLLRVLAGMQKPTEGEVQPAQRVALISTALALPPDVTPAQLSGYVLALRRPWWRLGHDEGQRAAIAAALERTGLRERANDPAATLSAGELQRAWIAAALASDAGVLLIDEPTTHLDLRYQVEVLRTLKTIARAGTGVVAAIHDLTLAARFADSIALLAGGAIECGPPDAVFRSPTLTRAFGVEVGTHRDAQGYIVCSPR